MLSGEFKHTLDPKKRLFIPAKHREELGESFMIARSIRDNCLKVYSMPEWDKYIEPILKMDRKDSEVILRTLHRNALITCFIFNLKLSKSNDFVQQSFYKS